MNFNCSHVLSYARGKPLPAMFDGNGKIVVGGFEHSGNRTNYAPACVEP
jgi:hypothetical protein